MTNDPADDTPDRDPHGGGAPGRDHDARPTVGVDVYSDYTCPWCYVGWARLEKARAVVADEMDVEVRWRPFEIHPEVPPEGMPVEELGYPEEQWARMQEALAASAAAEGLEVGNRPKVSNTHRALAAGTWVQEHQPERFEAFHEALFTGYFARGLDLGDPDVVRELAGEADVDVAALEEALDAGRMDGELADTTERARALGITGTPTFVFDARFAAVGAQPAETLTQALRAAAAEE